MEISVKQINKRIDEFQESSKKASTLEIGYKTYAKLMNEDKFADALKKDPNNTMVRYYKEHTQEKVRVQAQKDNKSPGR